MPLEFFGILAALGSAATWAAGALMLKPFAERVPAMALALVKGIVGLFVLGITLLVLGVEQIDAADAWVLFVSGILGIGIADTFFFKALRDLSSYSIVQLMLLGQVVTIFMAVVFLGESLSWLEWFGIGLIILGVAVVLTGADGESGQPAKLRGVLFGLISVLAMAVSITMAKDALDDVGSMAATFLRIAGGVVSIALLGPIFTFGRGNWLAPLVSDRYLAMRFLAIAIFVTFGGFFLSLYAVKHTHLAVANTLLSTEPLFVLLIAALLFGEAPGARRLFGSFIGVTGVGLISFKSILM